MDNIDNKPKSQGEEISDFSLKDFLALCLHKWWWFVICLIFSVGIALFYIYRQQPQFNRYEQILVTDQDSNGGVGEISNAFSTLGLFSKNTNVYNELITITSPAVLYAVADSLSLDMNYYLKDGIREKTLYGFNQPFIIKMLNVGRQEGASFRLHVKADGGMEAFKFVTYINDKKVKFKDEISIPKGAQEFDSPIGKISIVKNPGFTGGIKNDDYEIRVQKLSMQGTVELYGMKLKGDLADQDADVIELSIDDVSVQRAVDILNYVLLVYNQNYIDDKNKMAIATSKFIDERLDVIQSELGDVDKIIADYKKNIGTPDALTSIQTGTDMVSKLNKEIIDVSNQLDLAKFMKEYLLNHDNINSLLPVNLGLDSPQVSSQIQDYNDLLLNRNIVLNNSSETNPLVENYDRQLESLRRAINSSLTTQVNNLQASLDNLQNEMSKLATNMANAPEMNLPLLTEERQQMVKENLYLFLLQKREENQLTQKFSSDNVRVITPPVGSLTPISPRKGLIIIISIILGLGIPLVLIYLIEAMDSTVREKKDLDMVDLPFAGEIPLVGKRNKIKELKERSVKNRNKKIENEKPPLAVVEEGKRDVVNEAFRVVRGNIDFMSGKKDVARVIMLTSFNPGSGKSFITYNLGLSFSIKGKRVLIIDCDLRHGSSSMYVGMPKTGLSNYLSDETDNWENLVHNVSGIKNLSILPIGTIPPNPAELLENGKLKDIIEKAKTEYDIIFLDCPPVNIVVDTQIVSEYADLTIFVVRAGLLEKKALKELNEFYAQKKFKNMCVVLNGTEAVHSRYYTYGNYQMHSSN